MFLQLNDLFLAKFGAEAHETLTLAIVKTSEGRKNVQPSKNGNLKFKMDFCFQDMQDH